MSGKRLFDLIAASLGALAVAPIAAVIAALVRWKLGSPVLFRQQRPGLDGRPFELLKFRTMTHARGPEGHLLPDEERLTTFGAALRSISLDELPELWNVVRGDMSLVGPRPLLMEYLPRYTPRHARRHEVRPGITGWAQVNGRNAPDWEERLEMDVWYVENRSLLLDVRILLRTIGSVVRREGVSQVGYATVPRYAGPGGAACIEE
jgi:sugar transferase EpsL